LRNLTSLAVAGIAAAALLVPFGSASAGIVRAGGDAHNGFNLSKPVSLGRIYFPTISHHKMMPQTCCNMNYGGGPTLVQPHIYLILWGYGNAGDPDGMQALLTAWGADYGGSKYGNIATQYYETVNGKNIYPTNPKNNSSVWVDNTNAEPAHATDAQIQAEAWAYVNSQQKGVSDPYGAYIVNSSYNHDPQGFLSSGWCAYHGASQSGSQIISYTNEPYMPDAGADCGAAFITAPSDETSTDEGATIVIGHEYNESVSDPQPISGWYSNQAGEDGDACAWTNILNDKFENGGVFTQQPIYSDHSKDTCSHGLKRAVHKGI
jgi:hypothetical protein